jgi:hypothetical protein
MTTLQKMTAANLEKIPNGLSGIYAIYHNVYGKIDVAYVGRAKGTSGSCIKTRLKKHFNGTDNQRIGMIISSHQDEFLFSYDVVNNYDRIKNIEKTEIIKILPAGNVQINFKNIEDLGIQ